MRLVILALLLTGCATVDNSPIPPKQPTAPSVESPHIYLLDVPDEAFEACSASSERCGEVMNAYEATVESLLGWGLELEEILKTYQ